MVLRQRDEMIVLRLETALIPQNLSMFDNRMDQFHQILSEYWGYDHFRPLQEDIIRSVADGKDTLGLMPTGGGKSITFQVFALSRPGMTLVVTPLIALITDQVENLRSKGIKALAIYSGMSSREIDIALNNALYGDYKFLYVSPERLQSPYFNAYLVRMKLNLITVDEAHCISQWGYDFRPSYLAIADIRAAFPGVPVLALTATATATVVGDIQDKLLFPAKNVLQKSFRRENLTYLVRTKDDKLGYLLNTVEKAKGTGIIYVRSRKKCREIALMLQQKEITADYYHAGLHPASRRKKQEQWMNGECRVMVATNAFGMGIDKPDVRFVLHPDLPDSLEAYFQEAGRAGRDGKAAVAVMLFNSSDKKRLHKMVTDSFPGIETVRNVYQSLANYLQIATGSGKGESYNFHIEDFARKFNFQVQSVYHSLKLLERQGYLEYDEDEGNFSRLNFLLQRDELYHIQTNNKSTDEFIKTLLRSYSGLFTDYVSVDEEVIGRRINLTRDEVYQTLQLLDKMRIVHYIPRRESPSISFTIERIDSRRIVLSPENYQKRKIKYEEQVESVIQYAATEDVCRSVSLLRYFGEKESLPCGKCDICKGEHESGISHSDFERIQQKIIAQLNKQPYSTAELVRAIDEPEPLILNVTRWLLDKGRLQLNHVGLLKMNENENEHDY